MKTRQSLYIVIFIIAAGCTQDPVKLPVPLKGNWYLDAITDKSSGVVYNSNFPADTIILQFVNDTVYGGKTHRNVYSGLYTYDGDSLLTFQLPLSTQVAEDEIGRKFYHFLWGCSQGNFPCPMNTTVVKLEGVNTLVIDTRDIYKARFKKI